MHKPGVQKFGKRVLQIGLPVIILALFVYQVKKNWADLTVYTFQLNPWLLALAFLGFMLQELSYGLIWRAVLERLGSHLGLRTCLRIYLASEFVRYIPGNVWHVLTRILWVGKYGVSRPVAFASMAIELITKLAAGILVFSIRLLFWQDFGKVGSLLRGSLLDILGIASIIALFIGLHPRILNGVLNWALRRMKREPVQLALRYSDILFITLAWCASWIVAVSAFYVLLLALWPAGLASIMALLSRLVSTLAEVVCVSIAYLSGGKQVPNIQQDTQVRPLHKEDTNNQKPALEKQSTQLSTNVPVEGGVSGE